MTQNEIFNASEAGAYLGGERKPLSYQTLANWRTAGIGPRFTRLNGRMIRYLRSDLDAWLAKQGRFSSTSEIIPQLVEALGARAVPASKLAVERAG